MLKRIRRHFKWRMERFYHPNRWHLILDVSLITVIVVLLAVMLGLYLYQPKISLPSWIAPANPQIDLNNPPLVVSIEVEQEAIHLGDILNTEILLKNSGNEVIKDLVLNLKLKDENFTISKIETNFEDDVDGNSSNLKIENNKLMISEMAAGATSSTKIKVYFKSKNRQTNLINWQAESEYYFYRQLFKKIIDLPDIKVASSLRAQASAHYNSPQGDQLGFGPLPPVVGLPTGIWIFLKADASGNFKNFVMSAKLPDNVLFTDNFSLLAGNLNYNKDTRQVVWQINDLTSTNKDYRAGFEVQLIPEASQEGKSALLASNIKFQATDSFSGLKVDENLGSLNTDLENDLINKNNGRVISQ